MPRLVINTREKQLVCLLRINLCSSRIYMLFAILSSLANSGKGMTAGISKTKNLFVMFPNMTRTLTCTSRNSVIWCMFIAQFSSVVLKNLAPSPGISWCILGILFLISALID